MREDEGTRTRSPTRRSTRSRRTKRTCTPSLPRPRAHARHSPLCHKPLRHTIESLSERRRRRALLNGRGRGSPVATRRKRERKDCEVASEIDPLRRPSRPLLRHRSPLERGSRRDKRSRRPRFCTRVSPPSTGRSHRRLARHRRSPARPHLVAQQDPQQTIHRRIQPDLDPPAPGTRAVVRGTRGTKEARQDPSSRRPTNRRRSPSRTRDPQPPTVLRSTR